jgi:formate hydrogenlyase subunit 3/multisubunit Na+/H+ antiporter MnhD subunit
MASSEFSAPLSLIDAQVASLTSLDLLFVTSAATLLIALVLGRWRLAAPILVAGYALQFWALMDTGVLNGPPVTSSVVISVLGAPMTWHYDALSWFFALITIASGLACAWWATGAWQRRWAEEGHRPRLFHVALALNVFTMLLLVGSGDFLTLFLGWELVSWSSFLMMAIAGGVAARAALRYIIYAFSGAMALLGAIALLYSVSGSLAYANVMAVIPDMTDGQLWVLIGLLGVGFGVKMGLIPLHLWQAPAYAETPGPGSAFLGAISARMGLYGIIVVFVAMVGVTRLTVMDVPYTFMSARDLLGWIAAFTIIFPTYTALQQHDARYLLAWHGIGQGGYMLLGLLVGSAVGSAGGLLHVFNYGITQAALLLTVFAVMYRTGTSDLNKLGGLFTRMPLSFMVLLIGIISLAGLPPMAGFVSKWMVYRALIADGMPFLFVASVVGTLGTILSVYKLIHNMFLGQLRVEHQNVREAPVSMLAPMLGLSAVIFMAGVFPGPALSWVAAVQGAVGLPVVAWHLGGIDMPEGTIDMIWIVGVLFAGFGVGALVFFGLGGRSKRVHQLDNYAGGHFLTADVRYQYSDNFYAGLMHLIGGWYRGVFIWLEGAVTSGVELVSYGVMAVYRYAQPTLYVLATAVVLLAWVLL